MVLDEITYPMNWGWIDTDDVVATIRDRPGAGEHRRDRPRRTRRRSSTSPTPSPRCATSSTRTTRHRGQEGHRLLMTTARPSRGRRHRRPTGFPVLVWRFAAPCSRSRRRARRRHRAAVVVVNAQVPHDYERTDLDRARRRDRRGARVRRRRRRHADRGASVDGVTTAHGRCVEACATVGTPRPTWAADAGRPRERVAAGNDQRRRRSCRVALADAALVNAVDDRDRGEDAGAVRAEVAGTGTASDAVCVVCPAAGAAEPFARSAFGRRRVRSPGGPSGRVRGVARWRSAEPVTRDHARARRHPFRQVGGRRAHRGATR